MKVFLATALFFISVISFGQQPADNSTAYTPLRSTDFISNEKPLSLIDEVKTGKEIKIKYQGKWKLSKNRIVTGALLFLSGSAKGFNEGLQFNYFGFESIFPKANDQWFYPAFSFKNKYKDGDPAKGPRFPLSTSVLVMFTDQYHLNNFIQRASLTAAIVIKIGDGKKPLKHYLFDALYYTACYQAGFHSIYGPIRGRSK
jgi:hypothetical protein